MEGIDETSVCECTWIIGSNASVAHRPTRMTSAQEVAAVTEFIEARPTST